MPELSCILLAGPNGSGKTSAFAKLIIAGGDRWRSIKRRYATGTLDQ